MNRRPIALQLWTVRDAFAADPDRTLSQVKAAGFSAVELGPLLQGLTPARLADCLELQGLAVVSIHGDLPTPATIVYWADLARECRGSKLIWHGWERDPRFDSIAGIQELIAACNAAGALAREHGLALGMHNHWWEFEPIDGDLPIRLLNEALHPDIFWQLDVYWAQTAGSDTPGVVSELGPRLQSMHWKDGPCVHGQPMTALGQGEVDVPRILQALTHSVDWVIELDECVTDSLRSRPTEPGLSGLGGRLPLHWHSLAERVTTCRFTRSGRPVA